MRNTLDSADECCYFDNTVYAEIDGVLSYDSGINCNDYDTTATAFCDVCATVGFSSCGTNTETDAYCLDCASILWTDATGNAIE
jgi:hypothetical protein